MQSRRWDIFTSFHWERWNCEEVDRRHTDPCYAQMIEFRALRWPLGQRQALFPCLLHSLEGAICGCGWTGRTFLPSGRNDRSVYLRTELPGFPSPFTLHGGPHKGKGLGYWKAIHVKEKEMTLGWMWPLVKNDDATLCSMTLYPGK